MGTRQRSGICLWSGRSTPVEHHFGPLPKSPGPSRKRSGRDAGTQSSPVLQRSARVTTDVKFCPQVAI